jgi:hypothetical protein
MERPGRTERKSDVQKALAGSAEELDQLLDRFLRRFARVNAEGCERFTDAFAHYIKFTECPRDFREVAAHLGIRLEQDLIQPAGRACWQRVNGNYSIHYSPYGSFQASAFCLAHELFEILSAHPRFPTFLGKSREEFLANRFAAQFLMPDYAVKEAAQRMLDSKMRRYLVPKLADRFLVSRVAMRFRLWDLGVLARPPETTMPHKRRSETVYGSA